MPKAKLTTAERKLHDISIMNLAQELSYRVDRYNECWNDDDVVCVTLSVRKRREREVMKAVEELVRAYHERPSDAALRYFCGEAEVAKRDALLSASEKVTPIKRNGRPLR